MKAASLQLLRALRCSAFPHTPIKHCQRAFSLQRVPRPLSQHLNLQPISSFSTAITTQSRTARVSTDRGPISDESTQTDFGALDVLGNATPPTTAIDACLSDGFHLDNGVKITHGSGCLLVAGEAFSWRPWETIQSGRSGMINKKGQWEIAKESWGILDLVWPKPGILIFPRIQKLLSS